MTGNELRAERERLGVTPRELAEYADVTPHDIVRWEQCERVPEEHRFELAVALWALRLEAALRESGLPECAALPADQDPVPGDVARLQAHFASCPVCGARMRYVEEHVGPAPIRPTGSRLGGRVRRLLSTLRHWHRRAALGVVLDAVIGRQRPAEGAR